MSASEGRANAAVLRTPQQMDTSSATAPRTDARRIVDRPDPTIPLDQDRAAKASANQAAAAYRLTTLQTPSSSANEAAVASSVSTTFNFEGTEQGESDGWSPSDSFGAVGPNHYVETTNSHISIYDKVQQSNTTSATRLSSRKLNDFFGYSGPALVDPRVVYDRLLNRFIVVATAFRESASVQNLFIGVSQTSDATGNYWIYVINTNVAPVGVSGEFWDYPIVGMDHNSLFITANIADGVPDTRMLSIPKGALYNGQQLTYAIFKGLHGTLAPPVVDNAVQDSQSYFLAAYGDGIQKYTLTNSSDPSTAVLSGPVNIPVPAYGYPPDASQPGTTVLLDTLDPRFRNASSQTVGSVWQVHNISEGGLTACKYYRIDPQTNEVKQSGIINASSTSYDFNPSIIADQSQKAYVAWSSTDPANGMNAQLRVSTKDDVGTVMSPGVAAYTSGTYMTWYGQGAARWGDASSISLDGGTAWAVNNSIVSNSVWGTHIVAFNSTNLVSQTADRVETESLSTQAISGATHAIVTDANLSGGAGTQLSATGIGQYVTYTVPVSSGGTYQMKVGVKTGPKKGIFQLSIDGVDQGKAQDEYSAGVGYAVRDLGTVTVLSGGNKAFKFVVSGKNANSSGYGLTFDYIQLIKASTLFEAEALTIQAKSAATYGVFTDTFTSGGAFGLLQGRAVGDFVTYTVPVPAPGTYEVKVRVKTANTRGIFQLAVDGVNQGSAQDEYSPSVGYDAVRDVGAVTFATAGNKAFQFRVIGKNAKSKNYSLAFDYIYLVSPSAHFEAEALPVAAKSAVTYGIVNDANCSGGASAFLKAASVSDFLTYTVHVAQPGTYTVKVGIKGRDNKGIFQLGVDGVDVGAPQDEYSATAVYQSRSVGTITFTTAGDKAFKFRVVGRNPNSTGYELSFDYIDLVP